MEKILGQIVDVVGAAIKSKHDRLLTPKEFLQLSADEVDRATRYDRPLAVAMVSVDGLVMMRKAEGQKLADAVMSEVTELVIELLRGPDRTGHLGPGELGLLMPETTLKNAAGVAERLRRSMAASDRGRNGTTLSIGVAGLSARMRDPKQLLMTACFELRRAQSRGGNSVSVSAAETLQISVPRSSQVH